MLSKKVFRRSVVSSFRRIVVSSFRQSVEKKNKKIISFIGDSNPQSSCVHETKEIKKIKSTN